MALANSVAFPVNKYKPTGEKDVIKCKMLIQQLVMIKINIMVIISRYPYWRIVFTTTKMAC